MGWKHHAHFCLQENVCTQIHYQLSICNPAHKVLHVYHTLLLQPHSRIPGPSLRTHDQDMLVSIHPIHLHHCILKQYMLDQDPPCSL